MSFWTSLDPRYRVILCDVWGVIHNGVAIFPGAAERLRGWRDEGRRVILVTNAPRPAEDVAAMLDHLGLPRECWDGISTSGEAGIAALLRLGEAVGFMGTPGDRAVLLRRAVPIIDDGFGHLACVGTDGRRNADDYRGELEALRARDVVLHCLNPDRVVMYGEVEEDCAGAIADLYEQIGGVVEWYGKPHPHIYEHALALAGDRPREDVLAIGDALRTDMLGAARMGFDAVFVATGIHRGEDVPADFGARHGLGDWHPVATVDGLS